VELPFLLQWLAKCITFGDMKQSLHASRRIINLTRRTLAWLAAIYLAPLVAYAVKFGVTLSPEHSRWGEFGSAMAGIYAPIVALTTLAVLLAQVRLQRQMNDHEFRQAHISQAREDIEFYATQLAQKLEGIAMPGKTLRSVLHLNVEPQSAKDLDSDALRTLAANIDSICPSILGIWFGVYPILTGLGASTDRTFEMTLHSSQQKLIALLSFETCVALDNFYRARTEGKRNVEYRFSPLLASARAA
jgi:hypothetical protein